MTANLPPLDESARQRMLDGYHILDSLPEPEYDDIVHLASTLCGTPTALITLIDRDRQWFKARVGFDDSQTSRAVAVCDHAIRQPSELMEIHDLSRDSRFDANPYVNGQLGDARFYAGMPLITPEGAAIGTVCVVDGEPRMLDDAQRGALKALARLTVRLLENRARERALGHEAFIAQATANTAVTTPATPQASATTLPPPASAAQQTTPDYLLVLMELQDMAGTVARLGERGTEKLLQRLDDALEQSLQGGGHDSISRTSGSAEYVAVLHGEQAQHSIDALHDALARETAGQGLRFLTGVAAGLASEPTGRVFARADAALLDRKAAETSH